MAWRAVYRPLAAFRIPHCFRVDCLVSFLSKRECLFGSGGVSERPGASLQQMAWHHRRENVIVPHFGAGLVA